MAEVLHDLQRLAELLGWRGLRERCHSYGGGLIIWFETTDRKLHLQINPHPQGQFEEFEATVVALRYGFPPMAVGFHRFSLTSETIDSAAERLRTTLYRANFRNREWRKRFLASDQPAPQPFPQSTG